MKSGTGPENSGIIHKGFPLGGVGAKGVLGLVMGLIIFPNLPSLLSFELLTRFCLQSSESASRSREET